MKKVYAKLLLTLAALVISAVMIVSVSYAWLVLSNNPVAEGIQITIGGGNTILVAPDLAIDVDGTVYHYPGTFKDTLNFTQNDSYSYLSGLSDLTPVSTADGVNWFLPAYYDVMDPEVQDGTVLSGTLKSWEAFELDHTLQYANLSREEARKASWGNYIYLDFWVVSPGSDYILRVSTGKDSGGSYVIGLPEAVETAEGGYSFVADGNNAEACVRVGLLADPGYVTDETMRYYQNSPAYSASYARLRGSYQEPDGSGVDSSGYRFTIYEPNADLHPTLEWAQGSYLITHPIGLIGDTAAPMDVGTSLTVQTASRWADAQIGEGTQLEQRFQTAILEPSFRGLSPEEMTEKFYDEYLGAQVAPYVGKGVFVKNTENLYRAADAVGKADASFLGEGYTANATDDVYIVRLEKNVPQRIRMFIWLEGQDADCVNSVEASSFAFRIELAGSNQDPETQNREETQSELPLEYDPAEQIGPELQADSPTTDQSGGEATPDHMGEENGTVDESQSEALGKAEEEYEEQEE